LKAALKKINALTFYNLENKKKAKFITSKEIKVQELPLSQRRVCLRSP